MITQQEYNEEIADLARTIVSEAREYDQDLNDTLHETIDGHEWVIYTAKARSLASLMGNPDAWKEFGGEFTDELRAYAGMQEDVWSYIHDHSLEDEEDDS